MDCDKITPPDELRKALTTKCQRARRVLITSGGRKLSFYWLRKGQRLAVSVKQAPRNRAGDTLAKELLQLQSKAWVCPLPGCRVVFERVGRQKFCSPAHCGPVAEGRLAEAADVQGGAGAASGRAQPGRGTGGGR